MTSVTQLTLTAPSNSCNIFNGIYRSNSIVLAGSTTMQRFETGPTTERSSSPSTLYDNIPSEEVISMGEIDKLSTDSE